MPQFPSVGSPQTLNLKPSGPGPSGSGSNGQRRAASRRKPSPPCVMKDTELEKEGGRLLVETPSPPGPAHSHPTFAPCRPASTLAPTGPHPPARQGTRLPHPLRPVPAAGLAREHAWLLKALRALRVGMLGLAGGAGRAAAGGEGGEPGGARGGRPRQVTAPPPTAPPLPRLPYRASPTAPPLPHLFYRASPTAP